MVGEEHILRFPNTEDRTFTLTLQTPDRKWLYLATGAQTVRRSTNAVRTASTSPGRPGVITGAALSIATGMRFTWALQVGTWDHRSYARLQ